MFAERPSENLWPLQHGVLELDDVRELLFSEERPARVNGKPRTILVSPSADGVVILEHEPEGIDFGMAGST